MTRNTQNSYVNLQDVLTCLAEEKSDSIAERVMELETVNIKEGTVVRTEIPTEELEELNEFDHVLRHGPEKGNEKQELYAEFIDSLFGYHKIGFLDGERQSLCSIYEVPVEFSYHATDYWDKVMQEFGISKEPFIDVKFINETVDNSDHAKEEIDEFDLDDSSDIEI